MVQVGGDGSPGRPAGQVVTPPDGGGGVGPKHYNPSSSSMSSTRGRFAERGRGAGCRQIRRRLGLVVGVDGFDAGDGVGGVDHVDAAVVGEFGMNIAVEDDLDVVDAVGGELDLGCELDSGAASLRASGRRRCSGAAGMVGAAAAVVGRAGLGAVEAPGQAVAGVVSAQLLEYDA